MTERVIELKVGEGGYAIDADGDIKPVEDYNLEDPILAEVIFDPDTDYYDELSSEPFPLQGEFVGDFPKLDLRDRAYALQDVMDFYNQESKTNGARSDQGWQRLQKAHRGNRSKALEVLHGMDAKTDTLRGIAGAAIRALAVNDTVMARDIGRGLDARFRAGGQNRADAKIRKAAVDRAKRTVSKSVAAFDRGE